MVTDAALGSGAGASAGSESACLEPASTCRAAGEAVQHFARRRRKQLHSNAPGAAAAPEAEAARHSQAGAGVQPMDLPRGVRTWGGSGLKCWVRLAEGRWLFTVQNLSVPCAYLSTNAQGRGMESCCVQGGGLRCDEEAINCSYKLQQAVVAAGPGIAAPPPIPDPSSPTPLAPSLNPGPYAIMSCEGMTPPCLRGSGLVMDGSTSKLGA